MPTLVPYLLKVHLAAELVHIANGVDTLFNERSYDRRLGEAGFDDDEGRGWCVFESRQSILCQPPAPDSTPDSTATVTGSSITSAVSMAEELPPQPLHLPYEQQVTLCSSLQRLQEMATAQPRNWVRYCASSSSSRDGTLCMLTRCLFLLSGEGLLGTLKLVALGLRDEKVLPPPEGASPAEVAEPLPMPIGTLLDSIALEAFVTRFMLQGSSAAIRHEAGATLHHLWSHASPAERERLCAALRAPLGALPVYGANGRELMALLGTMMSASEMIVPQTTQLLDDLILHLKQQDKLLAGHPNAHVYHALGAILELEGHYLEAEPLHATVQPELPSQSLKLEALKAETKFTDSCQIVKFAGSNTIHSGVLRITDSRRTQMVSTIHLYCNNKPVADVGELKNKSELWKLVKTLAVQPAQAEIRFDFTIPVVATNLFIVYAAF